MLPASAMMFVSLPSYPPRGQATHMTQERVPPQHLSLSHPSTSTRDTNRSLRNEWGSSPDPTLSPLGSLSGVAATMTQYPAHSQECLVQLHEMADIDADVTRDAVHHTELEPLVSWQLATACVAAALPLPDTGEVTHDAAMVDENRALSPTMLDSIAEAGTGIQTSCCLSLLDTFGSCRSLMSLGSFGQPSTELGDLTPGEFAAMAAVLAPDQPSATPLQALASCGSNLAQAVYDALTEVPATSVTQPSFHPIMLQDAEGSFCGTLRRQEDASTSLAIAVRNTDAPISELPLGAGWVPCECSLPDLQDSPPALSSSDYSGESYHSLPAVSSDLSDARSAPLHPQQLFQHWSQAMPFHQAAGPTAVPPLAMDQQGATMAQAGSLSTSAGPAIVAQNISGGRRRRGRAGEAAASTRALRNREKQKQYEARKRVRENVTLSVAEDLQKHVERLKLDIEALCAGQDELLAAQEVFPADNHVSIVDLVSVIGLSRVDATPKTMADTDNTYWTQLAADLDLTSTQGRTLVEFHAGFVSELKMLSAEQDFLAKQLAEALKAADSKAIAANTLEIQHNHEVALELQARFTTASDKVLTEDQQKKLPGGGGTVLQPAQMEALCRALNVENAGAI